MEVARIPASPESLGQLSVRILELLNTESSYERLITAIVLMVQETVRVDSVGKGAKA
jgi:hypothetical protein